MRTYILALTKYGLTVDVLLFTVLACILLFNRNKRAAQVMGYLQSCLLLVFMLISYITLALAMKSVTYIFLCMIQLVVFFLAIAVYQAAYPKASLTLLNNMFMLMSIGLVIVSRLDIDKAWKQLAIAVVGLVITCALPLLRHYFYLLKKPGYIYGVVGIGMLAAVMLLSSATNGANITFTIAGVTFQPSEFVKILFLLFLASTLKDAKSWKDVFLVAIFAAAHVLILIGSTDLGSGLIFYVVFFFVVFLATGAGWVLAFGAGFGAIGAVACYFMFAHIQERVAAFLDPWAYIDTIGYQITQALFAISAGGAFGSGLGQGSPDDIFFADSDFVYASCCEEFGLIIGVCIIVLCLGCMLVMLRLAMGFADRFYQLLAYGCAVEYGFQCFLTIGGQTKFIPLTGVTLPFISYGGSSLLTSLIMFTLVQTMYILRNEKIDEYRKKRLRSSQETPSRVRSFEQSSRSGEYYPQEDRRRVRYYERDQRTIRSDRNNIR